MDGVTTLVALLDLFANGIAGIFTGARLILGTTEIDPSRTTVIGDITVASFTGYLPKSVTWGDPSYNTSTGKVEVLGTAVYEWFGPSDDTGETIRSWALEQPGAAGPPTIDEGILSSGNFDNPVNLTTPTQSLAVVIQLNSDGEVSLTLIP